MSTAIIEARAARDAAIAQVEANTDAARKTMAYMAIERVARSTPEFTTDDVKKVCRVEFAEPRIWGALMRRAAIAGLILRTERTRQSESRVCHCREQRVWQSLVCGDKAGHDGDNYSEDDLPAEV